MMPAIPRKLIASGLFSLTLFVILIALGCWQVRRLAWKENLLRQIATAQISPPIALPDNPQPFTKVIARGRWDGAHRALYGTDGRDGVLGDYVIEPLLRDGLPPLLVIRGFVAQNWRAPEDPTGEVSVVGYVREADHARWWSIKDDLRERHFYTMNPTAIGAALGFAPESYALVAMGDGRGPPEPAHEFPQPPNNHLNYAVTWFSLALIDLVIFLLSARKTLRS